MNSKEIKWNNRNEKKIMAQTLRMTRKTMKSIQRFGLGVWTSPIHTFTCNEKKGTQTWDKEIREFISNRCIW